MEYLDFEQPIKELEEQLDKCIALGNESNVDVSDTCKKLTKRLEQVKKRSMRTLLHGSVYRYPDILTVLMLLIISRRSVEILSWSSMVTVP